MMQKYNEIVKIIIVFNTILETHIHTHKISTYISHTILAVNFVSVLLMF